MRSFKHSSSSSLVVLTTLFHTYAAAWQNGVSLDLIWPCLDGSGTITQNGGQVVGPDSDFPCATQPPNATTARIDFPISGGRPQYILQNSTTGQFDGYSFISNVYIGQFSTDTSSDKSGWADLSTQVFEGLGSGREWGFEIDLPTQFANDPPVFLKLSSDNLVGVNATLGLRLVLFNAAGDNDQEMFQCSYVTLVAANTASNPQRDTCPNGAVNIPYTSAITSVPAGTAISTATDIPTTTTGNPAASSSYAATHISTPTPNNNDDFPNMSHVIDIAIAVPVVIVGLVGLCTGVSVFRCLRRRRRAKGKPTIALDFFVRGNPDEHASPEDGEIAAAKKNMKGKLAADDESESDKKKKRVSKSESENEAGSMHSEPLPAYDKDAPVMEAGDITKVPK